MDEDIEIVEIRLKMTKPQLQPQCNKSPRRPAAPRPPRQRPSEKEVIEISSDDDSEEIKPTVRILPGRNPMKRKASLESECNGKGKKRVGRTR